MLHQEEQRELLALARQAIRCALLGVPFIKVTPVHGVLERPCGAFVTIHVDDHLRGCIGYVEPVFPLVEVVVEVAVKAATQDFRFVPLELTEIDHTSIAISVLTPPMRISSVDQIEVGLHGLIIEKGLQKGLLLPQVAVEHQWGREAFLEAVSAAGVRRFIVHARKAWLQGLSPKENREVPPLDYGLVHEMKRQFPHLHLSINGGIGSIEEAEKHLADGMDGVTVGRAAYHSPSEILLPADRRIFGATGPDRTTEEVVEAMRPYIARHLEQDGRLNQVTRHMMGLFAGRPGARIWRRVLSERANREGAGLEVLDAALGEVIQRAA